MVKHFLSIEDFTRDEIDELFEKAKFFKKNPFQRFLEQKIFALIFEKPSTRTRVSFEVGIKQCKGDCLFISNRDSQISRGEDISDTARVLSRYVDGVIIRTFAHKTIEEFAKYSKVPVINALTDLRHPCQVLTDIFTIIEFLGDIEGKRVSFIGDGNNMMNSWITALLRFDFTLICVFPKGFEPDKNIVEKAKNQGKGKLILSNNPEDAFIDVDAVNTDVWASMGQEEEAEKRKKIFKDFQINEKNLSLSKKKPVVLHCLPAHKGEEITEEVFEKNAEYIFTQAENRLHVQKGIIFKLFN